MNTMRLLVTSPDGATLFVERRLAPRLPVVAFPRGLRLATIAEQWMAGRGLHGRFITVPGGTGRRSGAIDWAAWIVATGNVTGLEPIAIDAMRRHAPDATDRAVAAWLVDILSVPVHCRPTRHDPAWQTEVGAWIGDALGTASAVPRRIFRSDASAIVAQYTAGSRNLFFTCRPLPFHDPDVSEALRAYAPRAFPPTLARHDERGWWLTGEVKGRDLLSATRAAPASAIPEIMTAIARIQGKTSGYRPPAGSVTTIALESLVAGVSRLSTDPALPGRARDHWIAAGASGAPAGWIHSDPSPSNVRVDDRGRIAFIDLDDAWHGPQLLLGALAIDGLRHRAGLDSAAAWRAYVTALGYGSSDSTPQVWIRLARLVKLMRLAARSAELPALLLGEEAPRRDAAIASELRLTCGLA